MYYAGLGVINPEEDERDENIDGAKIQMREKVIKDLERVSGEIFEQINAEKNYKQRLEEKEFMLNLSPLN